ncbi:MAG: hypothetical protein LKI59_07815 [Bacteroidales bacterium]|jgi:hypothetical protein|nr:hypothetical protein [Bacteroidales bacterium]
MYKAPIACILIAIFLLSVQKSTAQTINAGTFHSPKGAGIALDLNTGKDNTYFSFIVNADFHGIINGKTKMPGIMFSYFYNFESVRRKLNTESYISFYAGPGTVAGYLKDKGKDFGAMGGLAADAGINMIFSKSFVISFGWSSEFAFHLKKSDNPDYNVMTLYKNGVYRWYYPELKILYEF